MRILAVADEECAYLRDFDTAEKLKPYDLILSAGDLKAEYLSFLVTMARCPLLYVHGNHDERFAHQPPEGCDCIDGKLVVYKGLRILGLGGSARYREGEHQYTQRQMARRIRRLQRAIRAVGGVDLILTHAAPSGVGDQEDAAHRGFEAFLPLLEQHHPKYLLHGHVHMAYGRDIPCERNHAGTRVVNCCKRCDIDLPTPQQSPVPSRGKRWFYKCFVRNLEFIL